MTALAWPAVALCGLLLAFVVALRALRRRETEFATIHDLHAAARGVELNAGRLEARVIRLEDLMSQKAPLDEHSATRDKLNQLLARLPGPR